MEDLVTQAIIFIYPDGTVEKVPISSYTLHMDYMREQLNKSVRFENLCGKLNFYTNLHDEIDSHLAFNGVVTILNLDLETIAEGYFDFTADTPVLLGVLPENLKSSEQLEALEGIYLTYPKNRFSCEAFQNDLDAFQPIDDIGKYLADCREILGSRK